MQQRMDADVRALVVIGLELVPQFRRLVLDVPFHVFVARAEVTLLGAGGFLVAAHADDDAGEMMFAASTCLKRVLFQCAAAFHAGGLAVGIGHAAL